jgi:hypothetical protein
MPLIEDRSWPSSMAVASITLVPRAAFAGSARVGTVHVPEPETTALVLGDGGTARGLWTGIRGLRGDSCCCARLGPARPSARGQRGYEAAGSDVCAADSPAPTAGRQPSAARARRHRTFRVDLAPCNQRRCGRLAREGHAIARRWSRARNSTRHRRGVRFVPVGLVLSWPAGGFQRAHSDGWR